jgi:hypothetical protein
MEREEKGGEIKNNYRRYWSFGCDLGSLRHLREEC